MSKRRANGRQRFRFSSNTSEWYTPAWLVTLIHNFLRPYGGLDLDPATCSRAQQVVQARATYTIEYSGLIQRWFGNVFCNPPFGRQARKFMQQSFLKKAIDEHRANNTKITILLLKAAVGYKWFRDVYRFPHVFLYDKLAFWNDQATTRRTSPHGSVLVYLGPSNASEAFLEFFSHLGHTSQGK